MPKSFSESHLPKLFESQRRWIEKKIRQNQKLSQIYPEKSYRPGDRFFYLGRPYELEIFSASRRSVQMTESRLQISVTSDSQDKESTAEILRAWYENAAYQHLKERVAHYEQVMKVKSSTIRVRVLEWLWGSCAASGNLSFNARLIMAPPEVVDYVVVHELSHLLHHNHSPRFWEEVCSVLPDYKRLRRWLREHGPHLQL